MSEVENTLKKLFNEFKACCAKIKSLKVSNITDKEAANFLSELKNFYASYIDYYDKSFEDLPLFKQVLYSRQKSTVRNGCAETVEFLGFDFDTDFLYAANLDESFKSVVDSDTSNRLERTSSVPDLNTTLTEVKNNVTTLERDTLLPLISNNMSEFDLKLANSLIPDFDGSPKDVHDFLNRVEFYNSQLSDAGKATLLDFVLKIKLKAKIADQVRLPATGNNFNGLKTAMLDRFSDKTNKEAKINQIEKLYQNDTIANFATRLENLCTELVRLKMVGRDETVRRVIVEEVDELAIKVFVRGLKRPQVQQALVFKEPATLAAAVKFALEADAKFFSEPHTSNVNAYTHSNNNGGRGSHKNNRGRNNGGQYQQRGRNDRGRNRGNNSRRGGRDNRQGNRRNYHENSNQNYQQNYGQNHQNSNNQSNSHYNRNSNNGQQGRYSSSGQNYDNNTQNNRGNSSYTPTRTFNNRNGQQYVNQLQHQGNETVPQQVHQPTLRLGDIQQQ